MEKIIPTIILVDYSEEAEEDKKKMKRAQNANEHISSIVIYLSLQLFCLFLRCFVPIAKKVANTPELDDYQTNYFIASGILLCVFILCRMMEYVGKWMVSFQLRTMTVCICSTFLLQVILITATYTTAVDYVIQAVFPDLDLENMDLTAKILVDFLMGCIRSSAICISVYNGLLAKEIYHLVKLDQPKKSNKDQEMEQKLLHPEKFAMEN